MTATALSAPEHAAPKRSFFSPLGKKDYPLRISAIVLYIIVVMLGATTSSIGMPTLRENPAEPLGYQLGEASPIRSDEYNAFSPIVLSTMATGGAPTTSVLSAPADINHRYSSGGLFETFVFFDYTLLYTASFLPDAMVFAAHWWLPALLLFLFLPTWFEQVGSNRRWGWMAAFLIALSPASSWWTMMPIQLIAYTIAGSSLLLSAYRRFTTHQRVIPALQSVAAGILIAGLPSFYIPWSLVLGLPILVATVAWVFAHKGRWKPKLLALGCSGITAMVFAAGMLWENREGISALLNTVYPGSRRSTGTAQSIALLFGAPGLAPMQDMLPVGINQSELSTAFTITFVWALLLIANINLVGQLRENVAVFVVGGFGLLWLLWCTVNFGARGSSIPLLNYVQPARAAQVCGILGSILVCLLLAQLPRKVNWKLPLTAAASCTLVTAYAVSSLQLSYLPEMATSSIATAALAVGLCVFFATKFASRVWPMVLISALAAVPVFSANPLLFGLGDLRESETAKYLSAEGKRAAENNEVWASDFGAFDTVMLANGVPSLSGLQRSGPNTEQWKKLDSEGSHANEWNRGGGFVHFQWTPGEPMTFEAPVPDTTVVRVDPCDLKLRWPSLRAISSSQTLNAPCLLPERTLTWSGKEFFVYKFQ